MKRISIIILLFVMMGVVLNIEVTARQGINFHVREIRMPLYLKALDYLDRHFNYKQLVGTITAGMDDKDSKVLKILDWVHTNIRRTPPGFPIVDDHPMNIIIRGYGVDDQFEDIFTILCYYAGAKAFYVNIKNHEGGYFQVSFVKLRHGWAAMSAYSGIYSKNGDRAAAINEMLKDRSLIAPFASGVNGFDEKTFLDFIKVSNFDKYLVRTSAQSPYGRLSYYIKDKFLQISGQHTGKGD